jgi:hypothetical protein
MNGYFVRLELIRGMSNLARFACDDKSDKSDGGNLSVFAIDLPPSYGNLCKISDVARLAFKFPRRV